jgi:hypothetical protein
MGERARFRGDSIGFMFLAFNLLPRRLLARMSHKNFASLEFRVGILASC